MPRLTAGSVIALSEEATRTSRVLSVGLPEGDDEETSARPAESGKTSPRLSIPLPAEISAVLCQQLKFEKASLPSALIGRLKRVAAFQNPEFYKRERLRLSTARIPRVISCADDSATRLTMPRGCRRRSRL